MFRKIICFTLIVLLYSCQNNMSEGMCLYKEAIQSKNFNKARFILRKNMNDSLINYKLIREIGKTFYRESNYDSAMYYYNRALVDHNITKEDSSHCFALMGDCLFMKDSLKKAKQYFLKSIDLKGSTKVTAYSKKRLGLYGIDDYYDNWIIFENDQFRFHFQDSATMKKMLPKYLMSDQFYEYFTSYFDAKIPKKVDHFTWSNSSDAKILLKREIKGGFARSKSACIHANEKTNFKHELTHVIFYFGIKPILKCKIINEGVAEYFASRGKKYSLILKKARQNMHAPKSVNIEDVWENFDSYNSSFSYRVGHLLIKQLVSLGSKEELFALFENQSLKNAKMIYGKRLDKAIKIVEKQINI